MECGVPIGGKKKRQKEMVGNDTTHEAKKVYLSNPPTTQAADTRTHLHLHNNSVAHSNPHIKTKTKYNLSYTFTKIHLILFSLKFFPEERLSTTDSLNTR